MSSHMSKNVVQQCRACVGTNGDCMNDFGNLLMQCPFYADAACLKSQTKEITNGVINILQVVKGCSAFDTPDECHTTTVIESGSGQHILKNCRTTCTEDDCNLGEPLSQVACYVCEHHQDHNGNPVGMFDPNCFDARPSDASIQMCQVGEQCMLDIEIDWRINGLQEVITRRSCGKQSDIWPLDGCLGNADLFPIPDEVYRDCNSLCTGDLCNEYNHWYQVALKHSSGREPGELKCKTCSYLEKEDSSVEGNSDCRDNAEAVRSVQCPVYADHGCFSAGSWDTFTQGGKEYSTEDDHRGCSSFHYESLDGALDDCKSSSGTSNSNTHCKHLCEGTNCNTKVLSKKHQCHTCTAARDSEGNTIGLGDVNCWENAASSPLLDCEFEDSVCVTEITVDWTGRGQQVASIQRGCKPKGFQKEGCAEVNTGRSQIKDCVVSCGDSGCNTGYDEVADLFNPSGPTVDSCYACQFVQADDGSVNGYRPCLDKPSTIDNGLKKCPAYANAACYVGANIHVFDGEVKEEVYRGCSTFVQEEQDCHEENFSGSNGELQAFGVCKETCDFLGCNKDDHPTPELPVDGAYPMCNVCSVSFDQSNKTVGAGDPACMEGGSQFNELCPNKDDICLTQLSADWEPRGHMIYRIARSCTNNRASTNCLAGINQLSQHKDCQHDCDPLDSGSGCNTGMEEVVNKFDVGNVKKCYACEYFENLDGSVQGLPTCADEIFTGQTQVPAVTCPRFANAACYHATSFHDDYVNEGTFTDDYRGCSPFVEARESYAPTCFESNFGEFSHKNCRETCQEEQCNTKKIQKTNRCYSCRGQLNSIGEIVGTGSADCFYDPKDSMIEDCAQDEDYCVTEMLVDWLPRGEQLTLIKRACSKTGAGGPCEEGALNGAKFKDCYDTCFGDINADTPCNNDLKVAEKFEFYQTTKVDSCFACRYQEHDDGTVEGNTMCGTGDVVDTAECPKWANVACYTGAATHNSIDHMNVVREVYKGCSTFAAINEQENSTTILPDDSGNPAQYSITKTSCTTNNCNLQHLSPDEPDLPDDPEPVGNRCQICSVTVDQFERQVGVGDIGCWQGDAAFEQDCGPAKYCSVDMEIDWFPKGDFNYKVVRGCKMNEAPTNCFSSQNALVQYKDCQVTCEIEKDGNGCNDGLLEVSKKFSVGKVQNCHRCEYYEDVDGQVKGTPGCRDEINNENPIPIHTCPMYADAACFYAGSYHQDYIDAKTDFEDDFRGCSPFTVEEKCSTANIIGLDHLNCKGTCEENLCNTNKIIRHLQCHQCQATMDQEGKILGSGDSRCFNPSSDIFLEDCPGGTTHCVDDLMVDWFAKGQQVFTITRGCYNADDEGEIEEDAPCDEFMSSRFLYKDCKVSCDSDGCNNDDRIYEPFQDEEGFIQPACYACTYQEQDNGDVNGNINCGGTPNDVDKKDCPKWANKACMTGTAVHNFEGQPIEEIYKGCSAFDLGGPLYSRDTIGDITFDLLKETCRDQPYCNTGHLLPSENSCYTCAARKDHLGNDFGFGDGSCWDNPGVEDLLPCADENDVCLTTMTIEWLPKGEQLILLNRGCGPAVTAGGQDCNYEHSDLLHVKTCTDICTDSACNNNLKVGDKFDQGNDIECYSCQYGRWQDGTILPGSNINCQQSVANENVPTRQCPVYLNAGCFQATTWHYSGDSRIEENFRGCSAFALEEDDVQECNDYTQDTTYTNCRRTCSEDNCNMAKSESRFSCYTCSETIDAEGNPLGVGNDLGCFSDFPSPDYVQECDDGELYCSTDLEADWFYRGTQTWRVRRGCSKTPAPQTCSTFESSDSLMHFKDCMVTCTASNCNQDLSDVVNKHDTGNENAACYTCSYVETESGDVIGNKNCLDDADKVAGSEMDCPAWANAGCFVGSNVHKTASDIEAEQVWKGCSSFVIDGPICASNPNFQVGDDTVNMAVCKEFCTGALCNKEHIRPTLEEDEYNQCYHCSVQMDHLGNSIGISSDRCFDNPEYTTICYDGQVCQTQLTVEWFPRGEQITKLERRCADPVPAAGHNPCFESSGQGSKVKQCTDQCDEPLCNNGLDGVVPGFDQGPDAVTSCNGCIYGKFPDGSFLPNSNIECTKPEISGDKLNVACPAYLNAACFTAATWHFTPAGEETEEDFKGCSAFKLEEEEQGCSVLDVNGDAHTACKETCTEDNCNNKTPIRRLSCYQCDVVVDSLNNTIGFGAESCWSEEPDKKYLQECRMIGETEATYCSTDIEADWLTSGQQTWRVRRKCATTPAPERCVEQSVEGYHMKDCATSCQDNGCNTGLYETAKKFDTNLPRRECYHCEFWEQDNGDVSGNSNCPDQPGLIENSAKFCPVYAGAGCYTGTNAHYNTDGVVKEHVYKGCSTFAIPETKCGVIKDVLIGGVQADYGYCQESCFGNLCNEFHEHPTIDRRECFTCRITKDHMGNTIGQGDDSCWNIPSGNDKKICGEGEMCLTEMTVDWMPKGEQLVILERKCGVEPFYPGFNQCFAEQDDLFWTKTCSTVCDEDDCNDNRDVEELFDQGNDLECYSCLYGEWYNGDALPNSNIYCQNMEPLDKVPTQQCPKYANAACFTAATWHFAPNGDEYEEDFRGCSAFSLEGLEACGAYINNGITHDSCRSTCSEGLCNDEVSQKRLSCYTCTVTVDQNNNTIGSGNIDCLSDNPSPSLVQECSSTQEYCTVDIEADWFGLGSARWTIRRGCSSTPAPETCSEFQSDGVYIKDCASSCQENDCNQNITEASLKYGNQNVDSCYSCTYKENNDGSVSGNQLCADNPDQIDDGTQCPLYAKAACFTASNAHFAPGDVLAEEVYKGCSSFIVPHKCNTIDGIIVDGVESEYGVCRETCPENNCNLEHEIAPIDRNSCFVCQVTKDFMGNTIGQGDESCWNSPAERSIQQCNIDEVCITEMLVDWMPKGEQLVTLNRRCGALPAVAGFDACAESWTGSTYAAKSCIDFCEESKCNYDREVENLFDQRADQNETLSCFSCMYGTFYNGVTLPNSNKYCQMPISEEGVVPTQACPVYANAGCFTAATWHYMPNGDEYEEDFKGCSTFTTHEDNELLCGEYIVNGLTYSNCRSTCHGDNCNAITPSKKLSCYTCDVTLDIFGNVVGFGDPRCASDSPLMDDAQTCSEEEPYCRTVMEADWLADGHQQYRVARGCSAKPEWDECQTFQSSDKQFLIKDCDASCNSTLCNDDIESVAVKFSTGSDLSCFVCSYVENDNGDIEGNINCGGSDVPEQFKKKCPIYADTTCFTGTNAHFTSDELLVEEVYKGCSAFNYDEPVCSYVSDVIIEGNRTTTYGICKEACGDDYCNVDHITPDVPKRGSAVSTVLSLIFTIVLLL